ncbi:hypothetical protein WICPIJ_009711 [Wickerhamomyces pijperi]|uniref:Secreted protein n=1 Tax=Wickerhamomyces pijperi TaxID=599730 RepID=A0A9P8PLU4_WICPI|nr:hypothetical protein WICPIJ_009711 [Wickerhamomyces pijperi]
MDNLLLLSLALLPAVVVAAVGDLETETDTGLPEYKSNKPCLTSPSILLLKCLNSRQRFSSVDSMVLKFKSSHVGEPLEFKVWVMSVSNKVNWSSKNSVRKSNVFN